MAVGIILPSLLANIYFLASMHADIYMCFQINMPQTNPLPQSRSHNAKSQSTRASANPLLHHRTQNEPFLLRLKLRLRLSLAANPLIRQLLKLAEALPPVLSSFMIGYSLEQISRLDAHLAVLVEQAQGNVEEPGVRLGCYIEKQANLLVGMDVCG
jgi:hypothetical protein